MTRKDARKARQSQRRAARAARQSARQTTRQAKATARQEGRLARQESRISERATKQAGRKQKRLARTSVKNAKQLEKIYGDLDPEQVNAVNEITPYVGAMNEVLEEKGVEVNDPTDPIEVAAKFEFAEPGIDEPFPFDYLDAAYLNEEDSFIGEKGKSVLRGVLGGISGAVGSFVNDAKAKERAGEPLKDSEKKLLEANRQFQDEIRAQLQQKAGQDIGSTIVKFAPIILIGIVALIAFRK